MGTFITTRYRMILLLLSNRYDTLKNHGVKESLRFHLRTPMVVTTRRKQRSWLIHFTVMMISLYFSSRLWHQNISSVLHLRMPYLISLEESMTKTLDLLLKDGRMCVLRARVFSLKTR